MKDKLTLVSLGVIAATLLGLGVIVRAKGAILLTAPDAELRLASRFGSGVVVPSGVQPVAAAARVYRPALLTLTDRRDGAVWQLRSHGPWGRLAQVRVRARQTCVVAAGPPLRIRPQVEIYPGLVQVTPCLLGRAGERYETSILKDGRQTSEPQVKIVDSAGTVLTSGRFQYG